MNISKAIIICIGDELLMGQTLDTNSFWLGQALGKLNIQVIQKLCIPDQETAIIQAIDLGQKSAHLIILSGGLGPTKDDLTKTTLKNYFNANWYLDEATLQHVKRFFESRNRPFLPVNEYQARVPDNCEILKNRIGTAPGMLFRQENYWLVSLPGVPNELKTIFTESLTPLLLQNQNSNQIIINKTMLLFGKGESFVAKDIEDIESSLPAHIKLAYLPNYGELRLRLTGISDDENSLKTTMNQLFETIANRLKDNLVATEDISLATSFFKIFKNENKTISTAESCTGGEVASLITSIPGASQIYKGSIVAYSNSVKENILKVTENDLIEFGAVSEAVVKTMAENVRQQMQTDYSIAISGILGPDGGSAEKPLGTVWMAFAGDKKTITQKFQFHWDRTTNKELAAKSALFFLLKNYKNL